MGNAPRMWKTRLTGCYVFIVSCLVIHKCVSVVGLGAGVKRADGLPWCKVVDCGRVLKGTVYSDRTFGPQIEYLPEGTQVFDSEGNEVPLREGSRWFVDKDGLFRQTRVSEVKGDNIASLKRSFARLRDLINCNALYPDRVLFVTFTYDPKRLDGELTLKKVSCDMRNSFARLRRDYRFEYIYTVEQQGNGRWHQHCLLFFEHTAPYLEQRYLEWVWQAGFVKVSKRFDDAGIANVGAYVVADLTYGEGKDEHGRIKNERLMRYKSGTRLYRCSRGIRRPEVSHMDYHDYEQFVSGLGEPIFESEKTVRDPQWPLNARHYKYQHFLNEDVL